MTTVHGRAQPGLTLDEAIRGVGFPTGIAMLSTPTWHRLAAVAEGECHGPDGPMDIATVFEARVFDAGRELRWLHESGSRGHAVLISEDDSALPDSFGGPLPALSAVAVLDQRHLLWGQPEPPEHPGWTTLYAPRIGRIPVPFPDIEHSHRIRLVVREYVAVEEQHGNAYVADERLLRLEAYQPPMEGNR